MTPALKLVDIVFRGANAVFPYEVYTIVQDHPRKPRRWQLFAACADRHEASAAADRARIAGFRPLNGSFVFQS